MAGIEVLGIVLGVLPLLVTALEHYEDTLRPIRTYRNLASRAQQFCDRLETERTIFRAECELLLSTVADRATARKMLNDPNHDNWKSQVISDLFGRCLGSLGTACARVIANMNKKLDEISDFCKEFIDIASISTTTNVPRTRDWAKRVRSKLKLAFSEPKLRESISALEALNMTFRTLSSQVARFDEQTSIKEKRSQITSTIITDKKTRDLKKFQTVRTAARLLYGALSRACTVHEEHFAKFDLDVNYLEGEEQRKLPSQVRFNLTFSHLQLACPSSIPSKLPPQCLRFVVVSLSGDERSICDFCGNMMVDPGSDRDLTGNSSKKGKEKASDEPRGAALSVDSASLSRTAVIMAGPSSSASAIGPEGVISRPEIERSICNDLLKIFTQPKSATTADMAMLEKSSNLIYYPSQSNSSHSKDPSLSLVQILGPISERLRGGLPQYLRLSIARSLSVAVLQFHTTPWFENSWQTENVCFFEDELKPGLPLVQSPHLVVRMPLDGNNLEKAKVQRHIPVGGALAPNSVLFVLGIMLLELAYGAPFHSLLETSDHEVSQDINAVTFIAARRLADNVGMYLGPKYARLVRKCLRCDFGSGEDLENVELQERLYEDVVCQLDELELGFRQLQVGS